MDNFVVGDHSMIRLVYLEESLHSHFGLLSHLHFALIYFALFSSSTLTRRYFHHHTKLRIITPAWSLLLGTASIQV